MTSEKKNQNEDDGLERQKKHKKMDPLEEAESEAFQPVGNSSNEEAVRRQHEGFDLDADENEEVFFSGY